MEKEEIKWHALEYKEVHRPNDWYWAVGITAFALTIGSILIKNFLFAIFIILATALVFYFSKKKPDVHEIVVNRKGIRIDENLYLYDTIKNFCIDHSTGDSKLLFMSSRLIDPIVSTYIDEDLEEIVIEYLKTRIPEKAIREPKHRLIMEQLGF